MKIFNIHKFNGVSGCPADGYPETKWDNTSIKQFIRSHIRESRSGGITLGKLRFFMEKCMNGYLTKTDLEDQLLEEGYRCTKDSNDLAEKEYNIRLVGVYILRKENDVPTDGAIFIDTTRHMVKRFQ